MAESWVQQAATLAGAVGLGGLLKAGVDWWAARQAAERREPAAMTHAAAELMDTLSGGGKELLDEFRKEFRYMRRRVAELQAEVDQGKADAAAARALAELTQANHARCETELTALRAQIAELMAAPVAGPFDKPPKDSRHD